MKNCNILTTIILAVLALAGCDRHNPVETPDILPNPEGTVTVNVGAGEAGVEIMNNGILTIDESGCFMIEGGLIVSLGPVKGLGEIEDIPWEGWTEKAPASPGNGYIVRFNDYFARIYVKAAVHNENKEVIGFSIDYQKPFELPIEPLETSLSIKSGTAEYIIELKHLTSFMILNYPDWCKIKRQGDSILLYEIKENLTAQKFSGKVVLANSLGKVEIDAVLEGADAPLFKSGIGTADDPFLITDAYELDNIRKVSSKGFHFALEKGIDLQPYLESTESGWTPIKTFMGFFDGRNNLIKGLWIDSPQKDYQGLFGAISVDSEVKRLRIELGDKGITGKNFVGGLAGAANCKEIKGCTVIGNISGEMGIGGLVGSSSNATVSECFFRGIIKGKNRVGGITYGKSLNISKCYSMGEIHSGKSACGICDSNQDEEANVTDCYSLMNIYIENTDIGGSKFEVCGVGGRNTRFSYYSGKITLNAVNPNIVVLCGVSPVCRYSYYNSDIMEFTDSGIGATTQQMMMQATYKNWNFATIWQISEGRSLPTLKNFKY